MARSTKRVREHVIWTAEWEPVFQRYATKFCYQNAWRCDHINDPDDLLQEAYLVFHKVKTTYPRVTEPAHFMALFKRALNNSMHDRANLKRRKDEVDVHLSCDVTDFFSGRIGELTNGGYLAALINEMPEEMKLVLSTLANGLPSEAPEAPVHGLRPREGLSMQLRRLLRLPINSDPLAIIKRHLT